MDPLTLLLAVIIFAIIGTGAGILTGLLPSLHVNTVAALVIVFQSSLISFTLFMFGWANPSEEEILIIVSSLIVGNVITHTFLDFIPSVYLGAPEAETALSVLPGHQMLLKGRGYEAIKLSALGSFASVFLSLILILPIRILMGSPAFAYEKLRWAIYLILLLVASLLILSEKARRVEGGKVILRCHAPEGIEVIKKEGAVEGVKELVPKIPISQVDKHLGEAVAVSGTVFEAKDLSLVLREDRGEIEVLLDSKHEVSVGEEIRIYGTVEAEKLWSPELVQKSFALFVFLLSGALGFILLSFPGIMAYNWYPFPQLSADLSTIALFPLFTGLFGLSTLILSKMSRQEVPVQEIEDVDIDLKEWRKLRAIFSGTLAGTFVAWYPGVSAASATVIARYLAGGEPEEPREMEPQKEFMVAISGVNTTAAIFTMMALFVIMRARSGATNAIQTLAGRTITPWEPLANFPLAFSLIIMACLVAALLSLWLTLFFGRVFARLCNRIPYQRITTFVILFLIFLLFLFSGPLGLLIGGVATCIGLLPPLLGVKRVHLMGCLILPIILFLG